MKNKLCARDTSIELLRIIASLGVIVLHYNYANAGGGFKYVDAGSMNFYFLCMLENVFICSVNLFVLISGYYLCENNKRTWKKVGGLVAQTVVINICGLLINALVDIKNYTALDVVRAFLPINYYVVLYAVLYLISPFINIITSSISKKQLCRCIILMYVIFSVYSFAIDIVQTKLNAEALSPVGISGSQGGYTIVNFVLMYLIGDAIRKFGFRFSNWKLIVGIFCCNLILLLMSLVSTITWNYDNPVVILEAILFFLLFKNFKMKSNIINQLSRASFTCFLVHPYLIDKLRIEAFVNQSVFMLAIHISFCLVCLYLISCVVCFIYTNTVGRIFGLFNGTFEKLDSFFYSDF